MRKGIRVFAAGVLLVVLCSSAAFGASRDSQDVSFFARFLAWVLPGRFLPPIGTVAPNSRLSPPGGSPTPDSRLSPPGGAPTPEPEPESRLSPPGGDTEAPPSTTT
jgi:hypothetical protein